MSVLFAIAVVAALGLGLGGSRLGLGRQSAEREGVTSREPSAVDYQPGSGHTTQAPTEQEGRPISKQGKYRFAGVATSVDYCSQIGTEILARHCGSAVDAAIASMLCVGVGNAQSSGIGGGHFMTIYVRGNQTSVSVNSREMAPSAATQDMFLQPNASSTAGGLAIGVPGEIMGMYEAHRRFGRLPWHVLFTPTIKLCREGIPVLGSLASAIRGTSDKGFLRKFQNLRELLINPATGKIYRDGERMKRPRLARTLEIIAQEGPRAFYTGSLAVDIAKDIQEADGIVTLVDLMNFNSSIEDCLVYEQRNGMRTYTPRPPSSGVVLSYILNILDVFDSNDYTMFARNETEDDSNFDTTGYKFSKESIATLGEKILTYHRIIEAFKFAYAKRTDLGDENFVWGIDELIENMTSRVFGDSIREMISDNHTHNVSYYGPTFYDMDRPGTAHISVLAPNGDAVSVTTTINLHFGSKVVGSRTGIIFNDEMDDFSTPNTTNAFGVPASPANFILPGKRPLSSMSPAIIVDSEGDVVLAVGAAGGTRITTTVAEVIMDTLWFGDDPQDAIDRPRFHHQLLPDYVRYDNWLEEAIVAGLKEKGHDMRAIGVESNCNAILRRHDWVLACSDHRKGGSAPDGY